jgi:Zn-dependent M28 family amino/carboxypeptidase
LICAHYDAVAGTPGADDNASGTAVVLEAARVLGPYTTGKTVTFALWDAEEIGLFGSAHYAGEAADVGKQIDAVINLDMVGWDGDGDRVVEVHTDALSASLADAVVGYAQAYSINVTPVPQNPGTGASDHASFWRSGYQAVLLIEEYYGADFNPYYHQPTDSLLHFNPGYYEEAAKLGIAATADLAGITEISTDLSPHPTERTPPRMEVYPSPFGTNVTIRYGVNVDGPATVVAFDLLGRTVAVLVDEWRNSGTHTTEWEAGHLPPGIYILRLKTGDSTALLPVVRSN